MLESCHDKQDHAICLDNGGRVVVERPQAQGAPWLSLRVRVDCSSYQDIVMIIIIVLAAAV